MGNNQKVFVGMIKGTNIFLLGQVVEQTVGPEHAPLILKSVVRVLEIPIEGGRIVYQFHPDPYFTNDCETTVGITEFLMWRTEDNPEDRMVREYNNFLTQLRMQKSGLVPGQVNPDRAKQTLIRGDK